MKIINEDLSITNFDAWSGAESTKQDMGALESLIIKYLEL